MARRVESPKVPVAVNVDAATKAALDAVAERNGYAVGTVARMCVESGLPAVRERLRKAKRHAGGSGSGA